MFWGIRLHLLLRLIDCIIVETHARLACIAMPCWCNRYGEYRIFQRRSQVPVLVCAVKENLLKSAIFRGGESLLIHRSRLVGDQKRQQTA